jgi:hypothetical protein
MDGVDMVGNSRVVGMEELGCKDVGSEMMAAA